MKKLLTVALIILISIAFMNSAYAFDGGEIINSKTIGDTGTLIISGCPHFEYKIIKEYYSNGELDYIYYRCLLCGQAFRVINY